MPSYIELDKQLTFPSSSNSGKMIFGVTTSNQVTLTDNNGVTYYFGTGSTMSLPTYEDINLNAGNYTISGTGVYEIKIATPDLLYFSDPLSFVGQTIMIINVDNSNSISVGSNGYEPYILGQGNTYASFASESQLMFTSIGGKWRGGYLNNK